VRACGDEPDAAMLSRLSARVCWYVAQGFRLVRPGAGLKSCAENLRGLKSCATKTAAGLKSCYSGFRRTKVLRYSARCGRSTSSASNADIAIRMTS
jgi:hypothetical protein